MLRRAKLTDEEVTRLRANVDNLTLKEWMKELQVQHSVVWKAYHSLSYTHLPPAANPKPPRGPYPHAKDQEKKI